MATKRKSKKTFEADSGRTNPVQRAIDYGSDVSMLIENLRRSPAERIVRHQAALETVFALRKAKRI